VGQNQILWAASISGIQAEYNLFLPGLGTMGFELPAAMGVKGAGRTKLFGGLRGWRFQMTMQELATLVQESWP